MVVGMYDQIEQQIQALGFNTAQQYAEQIVRAFPEDLADQFAQDLATGMETCMNNVIGLIDSEIAAKT